MSNGRGVGRIQSLVNRSWLKSAYMPHATGSIKCILSSCSNHNWNVPSLKLSANFCRVLLVNRYTTSTLVSSNVTYSDFIGKSPDYVLGKAGLFSTKLSVPELCYFTRYTQSHHFLVASLDLVDYNHMRGSAHACQGKRLRTIVCYLEIAQVYCAISRIAQL